MQTGVPKMPRHPQTQEKWKKSTCSNPAPSQVLFCGLMDPSTGFPSGKPSWQAVLQRQKCMQQTNVLKYNFTSTIF
eukprot:4863196-Ditylum_brightwellii.AAC.1